MTSSTAAQQGTSTSSPWPAFWVCVGVAALTILDLSKVNVGLPSIEESLGAPPSALQLIVAGYALAFGLSLVPAGRLGDLYSRKLMFVIGLSLFTLSSIACALAPGEEALVVARLVQGVAAGIQMPQVIGLIQQLFQGPARGRAFGLFGAMVGVSTALGPTLGGLLILVGGDEQGWRLLFWMNVPLGAIAIFFAARLLPRRQRRPEGRVHLDLVGVVLLGIAVLGLMLPFVLTTGQGDDPARWWFLAVFAVAFTAFLFWERRYAAGGRLPVVQLRLFRTASYRNGLAVGTVWFAALPAAFITTTLFLQQGLGVTPVVAGLVTASSALTSAVTSYVSGRIVDRFGRLLVVIGLVVAAAGAGLLLVSALLPDEGAIPWLMAASFAVLGAGGGLVLAPNQTLTLAQVPVESGGVAGSLQQLGQRVGTAIGTAIVTAVFFATITDESGRVSEIVAYQDAYRNGFGIVLVLVVLALVVALVDLAQRLKHGTLAVDYRPADAGLGSQGDADRDAHDDRDADGGPDAQGDGGADDARRADASVADGDQQPAERVDPRR